MAEAAIGREQTLADLRDRAVDWVIAHREVVALAALMTLALALRLWDLGSMALHHDESLHATYTWYLYDGRGYEHNPLMHGPFLFHSGALIFFLFGDSDFTARLLPALFGTALVGMPYLLRKQLGMQTVIIAAVLLTFSPTLLYFSRFYRNDIYIAVWTFAMVICIWRYLDEGRDRWLFGLAAVMALSFATKEVTFITVAILLLFLDLMLAVELGKKREGDEEGNLRTALRIVAIVPVAWLIAGLWPLLGGRPFGREKLPPVGDVFVVVGTLALPQFAAGIQAVVGDKGYQVDAEDTLRVGTVACLLIVSVYVGLLWRPKTWAIAAAFFYVPFVLLYTTFFFNMDGFFTGIWGSLDYWLAQHDVKRGDQPPYYYALLTPLYEFLPLLLTAAGALWLVLRGDSLRRWMVFWLAGIFVGLSLAGEKMPWLETHIALPLALIGAIALSKALDALELNGQRWLPALSAAAITAASVLLMLDGDGVFQAAGFAGAAMLGVWLIATLARDLPRAFLGEVASVFVSRELAYTLGAILLAALGVAVLSFGGIFEAWFAVWILALAPLAVVGHFVAAVLRGSKSFGRAAMAVGVAALFTLTVRASITAAFTHSDIPVEMLVYTQTSPDIPQLRDRIDALAKNSGLGYNLPIVVDAADSFAWPWAWYLRDYHDVAYSSIGDEYKPPAGAVLLINRSNAAKIDASAYSVAPYKHRWWFCESYRDPKGSCLTSGGLNFEQAAKIATDPDKLLGLADFFLHRRPANADTTGSVDAVAFFPNDLAAFDTKVGPQLPPREPTKLADGRILLGAQSANAATGTRGEFWQPADVFVDGQGNVWVADSRNNRIQKFDAQGNFLGAFGRAGNTPGAFNEPWSVAVDKDGFIYVADTWNHRIEKFAPNFDFVASWGQPGANNPGPFDLFGPRDIAIDADGTLWVTDTGNERLLHFSADGQSLGVYGSGGAGPGQFAEPVGLAIDSSGDLLVADTWNARIQVLAPGPKAQASYDAGWTSHEVIAKPYIAVLSDGRIIVTEPESGRLILYSREGVRIGSWQPLVDSMPGGVAATADGGFAFSDLRRNEVQIVPGDLMAGLFTR